MPHVELRKVDDGRQVCYASHSHTQWSMGAITSGRSTFRYREDAYVVGVGDLVLMNPEWVHACNPIDNEPWAYLMMHIDTAWLIDLRHQAGILNSPRWSDISTAVLSDDAWYEGYCRVADCLLDPQRDLLDKQTQVIEYLSDLMQKLAKQPAQHLPQAPEALTQLAAYLDANAASEVSLEQLCEFSGYSSGHQPHFQRTFKRLMAATPNQYRLSSIDHEVDAAGCQQ